MPEPRRFDLRQIKKEKRKDVPPIEILTEDRTFTIDPFRMMDDEALLLYARFKDTDAKDGRQLEAAEAVIAFARLLLGDDYDAFCEAGGSAQWLVAVIQDEQGATLGESQASTDSSQSTERPSSTTSSGSDATSQTSPAPDSPTGGSESS